MVKSLFFCLCFGSFFSVLAQEMDVRSFHSEFEQVYFNEHHQDYLAHLLMADASVTSTDHEAFKLELDDYINSLGVKRSKMKKDKDFVSFIFYKTHRKYLKRYTPFTTLASMAKTGKYDCLSATSLYSYLFTRLNIAHEVIETSYHIYVKINTTDGTILIESTDPIYGFVEAEAEIQKRLNDIQNEVSDSDDAYVFASTINETISKRELIGLQYYNEAVNAFNTQQYESSIDLLSKGLNFRNNTRTIEFGLVIAQSIMKDSNLDQGLKLTYVNKLQQLFHSNVTLASR